MRVLFITGDYPPKPGGIAVYGRSLIQAVAEKPEVAEAGVLAFGSWADAQEKDGGVFVFRHRRPGFLKLGRVIRSRIRRFKPDLIHVLTLFPEGAWISFQKRPYLVSLYGTEVAAGVGRLATRYLKSRALDLATMLLPISKATAYKAMKSYRNQTPWRIINPGLPSRDEEPAGEQVRVKLGIGPGDIVVMILTRLVRRKGVDHLLDALTGLPERIRLLIVGDGPDKEQLAKRIQRLGLGERAFLTGFADSVEPYFEAADIFALTSYEDQESGDVEGFGIVLLEAQAKGIPVIGTRSGGIPEAFTANETGLLVPPENPKELAEAILRLAEDPDLRSRMGAKGVRLVADKYQWPDLAEGVIQAYQDVLAGQHG